MGSEMCIRDRVRAAVDGSKAMSASSRNTVGTLRDSIADLTGPLGDRVRRGLPELNIVAQLGGSLREIRWG